MYNDSNLILWSRVEGKSAADILVSGLDCSTVVGDWIGWTESVCIRWEVYAPSMRGVRRVGHLSRFGLVRSQERP